MTKKQLSSLHSLCTGNMELVRRSLFCGCFYCLNVFPSETISVSHPERTSADRTAMCPFCEIDSVLPDAVCTLSPELLSVMNQYWFNQQEKMNKKEKLNYDRRRKLQGEVRRMLTSEEYEVTVNFHGRGMVEW